MMCRRAAATYADKILKGAEAGPSMERFEKSSLTVNLKTAEALGLTIPPSVLSQAEKVIK